MVDKIKSQMIIEGRKMEAEFCDSFVFCALFRLPMMGDGWMSQGSERSETTDR
jgi:hypothetical protein